MALNASWKYPENKSKASEFGRRSFCLGGQQSTARRAQSNAFGGEEPAAVLETRPMQYCGSLHWEQWNSKCKANRNEKYRTQTMQGETVVSSAFWNHQARRRRTIKWRNSSQIKFADEIISHVGVKHISFYSQQRVKGFTTWIYISLIREGNASRHS